MGGQSSGSVILFVKFQTNERVKRRYFPAYDDDQNGNNPYVGDHRSILPSFYSAATIITISNAAEDQRAFGVSTSIASMEQHDRLLQH